MPFATKEPTLRKLLDRLETVSDIDKYDDIPGWDGITVVALSDAAALLPCGSPGSEDWLPFSQLACDEQGNVYATKWLLRKKGLL